MATILEKKGVEPGIVGSLNRATRTLEGLSPEQERRIRLSILASFLAVPVGGAALLYWEQRRLAYLKDFVAALTARGVKDAIIASKNELTTLPKEKIEIIAEKKGTAIYLLNISNNWEVLYDRKAIIDSMDLGEHPGNAFLFFDRRQVAPKLGQAERDFYTNEFKTTILRQRVPVIQGTELVLFGIQAQPKEGVDFSGVDVTKLSSSEREALGVYLGVSFSAELAKWLKFGNAIRQLEKTSSPEADPKNKQKIQEIDTLLNNMLDRLKSGQERPVFRLVYAGKK